MLTCDWKADKESEQDVVQRPVKVALLSDL